MTDNSYAAPWQPININDAAPHVRSTYYAWAAVAQLLGAGNSTTQITALTTNNSYIRCYAAYAESALSSLVIINAQQVNASETKTNATFEVELPAYAGKTLYISYLTAAGADSTENTTWNGISYEQDSVGTAVTIDDTSYTITVGGNGVATIPVRDSQAVIAHIGSKLGSETVETVSSTGSGSSSSSSSSTSSSSSSSSSSKKSSAASSYSATSSSGFILLFVASCIARGFIV
ncbi:hypothetical protein BT93_L4874 [Corymbia citriodora subsp. variegata]|uniref:Beta-glucuronidase C-terminal domain-containing protein n=1 Tax=Corymbia citriodora subsp. variegata TaxID=360336 RepID=A0A8T0CFI8_CORYI|nr:hypothetical protein BT93_L4874 [Corymbia citriodora subsp. variegata]